MSKPDISFSVPAGESLMTLPGMGRSARDDSVRCLEPVPPAGVIGGPGPGSDFRCAGGRIRRAH
jgi:hypothetical protein